MLSLFPANDYALIAVILGMPLLGAFVNGVWGKRLGDSAVQLMALTRRRRQLRRLGRRVPRARRSSSSEEKDAHVRLVVERLGVDAHDGRPRRRRPSRST